MKLISLAVIAAHAIAIVHAGNIPWRSLDPQSQYNAGVKFLEANQQFSAQGKGGCAVAVIGCLGAVAGFCFCVAGPQAAVCGATVLPSLLGGFFGSTFTAAMYECNDIPYQGLTAKQIRCKAAKVWMANYQAGVPGNDDMSAEYDKCFPQPECHTKDCWTHLSVEN